MPSFISRTPVSNPTSHSRLGMESNAAQSSRMSDFGALEQYLGYRMGNVNDINPGSMFNPGISGRTTTLELQPDAFSNSLVSSNTNFPAAIPLPLAQFHNGPQPNIISSSLARHENWGNSSMAESSPHTDTSTGVEPEDKNQQFETGQSSAGTVSNSSDKSKENAPDQKTLRRLAQNREAARKSRLRKKAYVQQLETSRMKLTQIEQEMQRARQQGVFISSMGDQPNAGSDNGAVAFDAEYARWMEEHTRQINELRTAVNLHADDTEIRTLVDNATAQFDDIFRLKGNAAKIDVFHILLGMWKTPAERCFLWIGGFRPSDILKLLANHLETLTEQQLTRIHSLQQSSEQAENALAQGMDALQKSLAETLANSTAGPEGPSGNVAAYMGQMAMAMGKLGTLENFLRQADNLRQQTLQQMHCMLTTRQSARVLLWTHDYFSRLRALSSLWRSRPRE